MTLTRLAWQAWQPYEMRTLAVRSRPRHIIGRLPVPHAEREAWCAGTISEVVRARLPLARGSRQIPLFRRALPAIATAKRVCRAGAATRRATAAPDAPISATWCTARPDIAFITLVLPRPWCAPPTLALEVVPTPSADANCWRRPQIRATGTVSPYATWPDTMTSAVGPHRIAKAAPGGERRSRA